MELDAIKAEYCRIRNMGVEAKAALTQLRSEIVRLELGKREKLLEELRVWEISRVTPAPQTQQTTKPAQPVGRIKPLQASVTASRAGSAGATPATRQSTQVTCPHCGKVNRSDDVFCYGCGQLLSMERGLFDTRHFVESKDGLQSDEYFGPDMVLVFALKETQQTFSIRPQERQHEIIVGRGAGGTMKPDIDLTAHRASELGVSRLHLSVAYNEKRRTLSVSDLGSANGTYINGVRLHPEEVRILRHGDELRLGKLIMTVYFHQGKPASRL